jgi:hypothetical protein
MVLRHKLNKEIARGKNANPFIIKQLREKIRQEEEKRGKKPRRGL